MRAVSVVAMEPPGPIHGSVCQTCIGTRVRPLAKSGLDEALGFAIGARGVRPRAVMPHTEITAGLGKAAASVAGAVIGEHRADAHTEECGSAHTLLIGQDLRISNPRGVIDRHVHELPARASLRAAAVAGDAMTDAGDAPELFHIQMQQLPGRAALIATPRPGGLSFESRLRPARAHRLAAVLQDRASCWAMAVSVSLCRRSASTASSRAVALGLRCGLQDRA
jgi:hypothetical protein